MGTPLNLIPTGVDLQNHKDYDVARWNDYYITKQMVLDLQANIQNKKLDTSQEIDIETEAQTDAGYTVTNTLGGRIYFEDIIVLLDIVPGIVYVNGLTIWNTGGLGLGQVGDSADVANGDVVTCGGITAITFVPYVAA